MPRQRLRKARKLAVLMRRPLFRRGLRRGVAAAVEHRRIDLRSEPRTILDVGAHTGQFALLARDRFSDARIHCFEPQPAAQGRLRQVLRLVGDAQLHPVAIGCSRQAQLLHVSRSSDSSSLLPIGQRQASAFPHTEAVGAIKVPVVPLSDVLSPKDLVPPCLLKVDVQGYELEVLRGCEQLLPLIDEAIVELSFVELYTGQPLASAVIRYMDDSGFDLSGFFNPIHDKGGACLQADGLFTRRTSHA